MFTKNEAVPFLMLLLSLFFFIDFMVGYYIYLVV